LVTDDNGLTTVYYANGTKFAVVPPSKTCGLPEHSSNERVKHGWQAYSTYYYPKGIGQFLGNFSVPDTATDPSNELLYIFTGLQNIDWIPEPNSPGPRQAFDIIQPVLQFPGDKGKYWSIKSWYVTVFSGYYVSPEVKVDSGDVIYGNMTQTGSDSWFIESLSTNLGVSTNLTCSNKRLVSQPWAYCTLEVYNVNSCNQYPDNPILFTGMTLADVNGNPLIPTWNVTQGVEPACKEHAVVNSPGSVTIYFQ